MHQIIINSETPEFKAHENSEDKSAADAVITLFRSQNALQTCF